MKKNNDQKVRNQQRNKLLLMPLLVIPMVTLLFKILGGGGGDAKGMMTASLMSTSLSEFPSSNAEDLKANKTDSYKAIEDQKNYLANDFSQYTPENTTMAGVSKTDTPKIPANALQKANQEYFDFYKDSAMIKQVSNNPDAARALSLSNRSANPGKSYKQPTTVRTRNDFNDEGNDKENNDNNDQATGKLLKALIHGTQTVRSNSRVTIRLLEPFESGDISLKKNDFIWGTASASYNGRLSIKIKSISVGDQLVAVSWTIYDIDGNEGIHVPYQLIDNNTVQNQTVTEGTSEVQSAVDQTLTQALPVPGVSAGARLLGNLARNKSNVKRNNFTVKLDSGNIVFIKVE